MARPARPAEPAAVTRLSRLSGVGTRGLLGWWLVACATPATPPPRQPTTATHSPDADIAVDLTREAEQAWDRRDEASSLARAIELWQHQSQARPQDAEPQLRLAQALLFRAWAAHVQGQNEDACRKALGEAEAAAQAALDRQSPTIAFDGHSLGELPPDEVAEGAARALYWLAAVRRARAQHASYAEALQLMAPVREALRIAVARVPQEHHGGPHRELGVSLAQPLAFEDRKLDEALEQFERARGLGPDYLRNHLDFAAHYAVAAQDSEAFQSALLSVIDAPQTQGPLAADNALSLQQARALRDRASELFE